MAGFTEELRERLYKLGTTNISDAMDALGFSNVCCGIEPLYESCKKIVGSHSALFLQIIYQNRNMAVWKRYRMQQKEVLSLQKEVYGLI